MRWIALLLVGALGYVLGSRAGRGPYETLSTRLEEVWRDPRVQGRVRQATSLGWHRPGEDDQDLVPDLADDMGDRDVSAGR